MNRQSIAPAFIGLSFGFGLFWALRGLEQLDQPGAEPKAASQPEASAPAPDEENQAPAPLDFSAVSRAAMSGIAAMLLGRTVKELPPEKLAKLASGLADFATSFGALGRQESDGAGEQ